MAFPPDSYPDKPGCSLQDVFQVHFTFLWRESQSHYIITICGYESETFMGKKKSVLHEEKKQITETVGRPAKNKERKTFT
jgi:hypothetical protein